MSKTQERAKREPIATRVDPDTLATIEHLAEQRRTTPAQIARVLIEDGVRGLASANPA